MAGLTKKKRVSKKTKSSWRKHVDITDVDNYLEEQRLEERLGPSLELVKNEDLFVLDTTPSTQPVLNSKQAKRLRLRQAPIKCHSLLKPFTNVPDPITKRNRVRTKEERKNALLKKKEVANRAKGIYKKKDVLAVKDRKLDDKKRSEKPSKGDFNLDIWSTADGVLTGAPELDIKVKLDEWITGDSERHILHGPGKPTKLIPNTLRQRSSVLEPVEIPHPGTSYNPSYKDHQDLLKQIVEKEKKIIKEEEHLNRVTRNMFRKVTAGERDSAWMTEMSQGLLSKNVPEEEAPSDTEYKSVNPPTENKKKSLKQRRKQKEQLQLEQARRKAKEEKKKIADIHKLRFINKSIEKASKKAKILHEKRLKVLEYKKREAKRLGSLKFEEPDVDFNLGGDISGNLRGMKMEGNLLNDRFKSLQKRNIIEPTAIRMIKRAKVKRYQKAGFKDDWKSTVAKPGNVKKIK